MTTTTESNTPRTEGPDNFTRVRDHVRSRCGALQARAINGDSTARRDLARLRAVNLDAPFSGTQTTQSIWNCVSGLEPWMETGKDLTALERAALAASHLHAIHQQGHSTDPTHRAGGNFGASMRALRQQRWTQNIPTESLDRRFHIALSSNSQRAMIVHLRPLVQMMSAAGITVDYGRLASDLFTANTEKGRQRIRATWGRTYTATPLETTEGE